jgi:hypothetical protein
VDIVKKEMDPTVAASNVYKVLKENDRVRVLEVIFKPGDFAGPLRLCLEGRQVVINF